jgi:hypothetical protein
MRSFHASRLLAAALVGALSVPVIVPCQVAFAGEDAKAQAEAKAKARETWKEGLQNEATGKWEAALAAFKKVAEFKSTPEVRYHIAFCTEKMGHYVDALGAYKLALFEAHEARKKDVEKAAQEALSALEPKIPKLTIVRGDGATVAEVTLDGVALGPASIGASMQANPGPHVVKATAPGRDDYNDEFSLADAEVKTITLKLPETPKPVAKAPPPAPVAPEPPPSMSPMRVGGFIGVGVGAVSLAMSGIFALKRSSAISDLDAQCGADRQTCPFDSKSTYDSGKTAATVTAVTLVTGVVAAGVGGALLYLSSPKKKVELADAGKPVALVLGGPTGLAGASVVGSF